MEWANGSGLPKYQVSRFSDVQVSEICFWFGLSLSQEIKWGGVLGERGTAILENAVHICEYIYEEEYPSKDLRCSRTHPHS